MNAMEEMVKYHHLAVSRLFTSNIVVAVEKLAICQ